MSAWGFSFSPTLIRVFFFFLSQLLICQLQGISLRFPSTGKMSKRCRVVDFYVIYLSSSHPTAYFRALKQISGGISSFFYTQDNGYLVWMVLHYIVMQMLLYLWHKKSFLAADGSGFTVKLCNVNSQIWDQIWCLLWQTSWSHANLS